MSPVLGFKLAGDRERRRSRSALRDGKRGCAPCSLTSALSGGVRVPARFGSQVPGKEGFPAHSSKFDFDEEALAVGVAYYQAIAKIAGQHLHDQTTRS